MLYELIFFFLSLSLACFLFKLVLNARGKISRFIRQQQQQQKKTNNEIRIKIRFAVTLDNNHNIINEIGFSIFFLRYLHRRFEIIVQYSNDVERLLGKKKKMTRYLNPAYVSRHKRMCSNDI